MKPAPRHQIMPWYGYLLANVIVAGGAVLVHYLLVKRGLWLPEDAVIDRPAIAPLLTFVVLAFLAVSVYDFCYDRIATRRMEAEQNEIGAESD